MRLRQWIKRKLCHHDLHIVWEEDYRAHVLGEKPSGFHNLSGSSTVRYCPKCGHTEEGPFIKTEEVRYADRFFVEHFSEGKEGDPR